MKNSRKKKKFDEDKLFGWDSTQAAIENLFTTEDGRAIIQALVDGDKGPFLAWSEQHMKDSIALIDDTYKSIDEL